MTVEFSDEQRKKAMQSLHRFVEEELDQDIGDLKAGRFLDFILKEIGPCIYNHAIGDAQTYLRDRLLDLEAACYYPEFTYWLPAKGAGVRRGRSD